MTDQRNVPTDLDPTITWQNVLLGPSTMGTFRRADGELLDGEFGWTTDLETTEDSIERPLQLVEETWQRATYRLFWLLPEVYGSCEMVVYGPTEADDADECDEDAVAWWQNASGEWLLVCSLHDPGADVIACQG